MTKDNIENKDQDAKTDKYKTNPEHPGRPTLIELFVGIGGGQEAADPQH